MGHIRSCVWGHVAGIKGRWPRFYSYKFLHWIGPELFLCGYSWGGRGAARIVLWDLLRGGGGGSFSVYLMNRFVWPFPDGPSGCGGGPVRCPKLRAGRGVRASLTEVDPAGKLQWHFTCGFDFRHSLWLPFEAAFAIPKGLNICILNLRQWIDLFLNCDHFIIAYHIA